MLKQIPIEQLHRNTKQPRQHFDEVLLTEMAESFKTVGIIEPITARPSIQHPGMYEIVAGERRWRAAQIALKETVPVVIRDISDEVMNLIAIVENVQREPLNPIEESRAYKKLIDEYQYLQSEIASSIGKSESHISHLLNLLSLDARVQSMLEQGSLKLGHGKALCALPEALQYDVASKAVKGRWSVRKIEDHVRWLKKGPAKTVTRDFEITRLEERFSEHLAAPITINHNSSSNKGKIIITYSSLDELDSILQRSGFTSQTDEY